MRRLSLLARLRRPRGDAGTSLVEVLAAIVVFGLLASAVLATLLKTLDLTADDTRRVTAANLAARQVEVARHMTLSALQAQASPYTFTSVVSGKQYTVTQTTAGTTQCGQKTCDPSVGSAVLYERVTVVVTWPGMGGTKPVRSDTLRQLAGPGAVTTGALSITVLGSGVSGPPKPQAGLSVQLANPSSTTWIVVTDANGLAQFANLPPGTNYTVTVSATGYRDPSDNAVASANNLTVVAGQTTTTTLKYDQAGSITYGFSPPSGYALPGGVGVTVAGQGSEPPMVVTGSGSTRTASGLYPDVYNAWAGDCADASPSTYGANPAGTVTVASPGSSSNSGTVPLVGLALNPNYHGQLASPNQIYAVHAAAGGCPNGESLLLATGPFYSFPIRVSLPYGAWTLAGNATAGSPPFGGWSQVTLTPSTANPSSVLVNY